jgi:hypothetical protein
MITTKYVAENACIDTCANTTDTRSSKTVKKAGNKKTNSSAKVRSLNEHSTQKQLNFKVAISLHI